MITKLKQEQLRQFVKDETYLLEPDDLTIECIRFMLDVAVEIDREEMKKEVETNKLALEEAVEKGEVQKEYKEGQEDALTGLDGFAKRPQIKRAVTLEE
jgi:hypothetical protein